MAGATITHIQAIEDRRTLLKHTLQDLKSRGRDVLLPVGCAGYDDWLLDALNVERVLKQVGSGQGLDLIQACTSTSTAPLPAPGQRGAPRSVAGSTPRQSVGPGGGYAGEPPVVSFGSILGTADGMAPGAGRGPEEVEADGLPQLQLKSLRVGLEDHQLKELAYSVFLGCSGGDFSPQMAAVMRAQLEISEARAAELQSIVSLVASQGITSLATLEMHAKLLQVVRPSAFESFKNFVWWRETVTAVLWSILQQATREHWVATPAPSSNALPTARSLLARLRGGLRRLDVREKDDYDEGEYGEAAEAVFVAAGRLAEHCTSGWSFPWGLRARMAEMMLRGVFDTLEEGSYVAEQAQLLEVLQGSVWPQLGISSEVHSAIYAWVHYRQYCVSGELQLLDQAKLIVQLMKPMPGGGAGAGINGVPAPPPLLITADEADAAFPEEVLGCMADALRERLSDYHGTVPEPRAMKGLLELAEELYKVRGRAGELPGELEGCIAASMEAAFGRAAEEVFAKVHVDEDRIMLLAAAAGEVLRTEFSKFSPLLLPYVASCRAVAARTLHELYGAKMLPWLIAVNGLTKSALEAIRCSMELEEALKGELQSSELQPWGTMERLSPLLYTWTQGQVSMLKGWMTRIMAGEDWKRVNKQRAGGSRSVVETIKIVTETLEALFDMRLPVPGGVVRALATGLDEAMQRYCEFILGTVGTADALIPPSPPLTRYKRELIIEAEQAEQAAFIAASQGAPDALGTGAAALVQSVRQGLKQGMNANWLPPLGQTEEERRIMNLGYDSLVVMLNSIQHLVDSFAGLERMVVEKWDDGRPKSAKAKEGAGAYDWIPGMFDGAKHTAAHVRDHVCRFIAMKLVYGDMREVVFERLYRFRVQSARLELVLQEVDRHLGEVCSRVHDALPPRLARSVLQALVQALRQVLLDGGPYRLFTVDDAKALDADLAQMRAMFFADGDGLPLAEIDAMCRPLSDLLDVMELDTGLVMQNLKQARPASGGRPRASPRAGMSLAMDPDVLLRVLCHRADHAASKFLKKDYKISKKIPGAVAQSVGKASSSFGSSLKSMVSSKR